MAQSANCALPLNNGRVLFANVILVDGIDELEEGSFEWRRAWNTYMHVLATALGQQPFMPPIGQEEDDP